MRHTYMNYGHDTEILVLNLTAHIDATGLQRFEDIKKKKSGFYGTVLCVWKIADNF
jgi:hypothetical protein